MDCISLNGTWKLKFAPEQGVMPRNPQELEDFQFRQIDAVVPGNVEIDLVAAGIESDPYYGTHSLSFRKYEFYSWWFEREFDIPDSFVGHDLILHFEGIDTYGTVFINGHQAGQCENMLVSHDFDITSFAQAGRNRICVHISSAMNHAREKAIPVGVRIWELHGDEFAVLRKPAHSFGWDISARLLSAGIWRDVMINARPSTYIKEVYYSTVSRDRYAAMLSVRYRFVTDDPFLEAFKVRVTGQCGNSRFVSETKAMFVAGKAHISISEPMLWNPRGYGDQNLYTLTFELIHHDVVMDTRIEQYGIRTVVIEKSYKPNDAGEFKFVVNGTAVLVKGTNWVFLDCLHSRDIERLPQAHALLDDIGCNMVRMWGGNVYENEEFYRLCDEKGILVWQDFSMACALYSQYDDFARIMEDEASKIIVKLRNHTCIALWAGDNEVDEAYIGLGQTLPHARHNRITREILPRTVGMHDPYREYIASSPYIPEETNAEYEIPEQHNWGPRDYFKGDFYKHSTAHFISETGYHGCPSVSSIKQFIPESELWPYSSKSDSWAVHNSELITSNRRNYDRNELMINQVRTLFGTVPDDMAEFVFASQISQAEAKKFFIENTRIKKWRRTGVLWWNLIDGWPQISDAVVDYYFKKKIAYHYIRRLQQPVCIIFGEAEAWQHRVVLSNDGCSEGLVTYHIIEFETGKSIQSGKIYTTPNENIELPPIGCVPGEQKLYLIEWEMNGKRYGNHYASGYVPMNLDRYKLWLNAIAALPEPFDPNDCIL
jgi:beta-mannosidase